jgi:AcrR family transcriptional regulator
MSITASWHTVPVGLREQKKAETRIALMRAALRLFADRGFEATTVEEIAAAAGVSPRTFFRYYPTKVDVLFGDFEQRLASIRHALDERESDESLLRRIRRTVAGFADEFAAEPELFSNRARLVFSHPDILGQAHARFAAVELLVAGAAARELEADPELDVRPRILAAAVTAGVRTTALTWAARGGRGDPREIVEEVFDVLETGLASVFTEGRR